MRLICPNCDAQYEVDDSVIPSEGRDVQCSSCGLTWFQKSAAQLAEEENTADAPKPEAETEETPQKPEDAKPESTDESEAAEQSGEAAESRTETSEEEPAPRKTDESVLGILREEAAREAAARAKDAKGTQDPEPKAGLDLSKTSSDTPTDVSIASAKPHPDSQPAESGASAHRDRLPDIDEINSTLRAATDSLDETAEDDEAQPSGRRGFRLGFSLVLILATLGLLAYIFAPDIVQRFPESEPYMVSYVEQVNNLRDWLDQMMKLATDKMSGTTGN
ncbi:zinc-ribbon domain-containing protein [Profundibacter sp.]